MHMEEKQLTKKKRVGVDPTRKEDGNGMAARSSLKPTVMT
jgi:hypothetical protein